MEQEMLYHLVEKVVWDACLEFKEPYFPATFEKEGFIHLTKDPHLLLTVANSFYQSSEGDWICLVLDPSKLTAEVKYEPAATEALTDGKPAVVWEDDKLLFPHLYGTINYDAVVDTLTVVRSHCGRFVAIEGLPAATRGSSEASIQNEDGPTPAS